MAALVATHSVTTTHAPSSFKQDDAVMNIFFRFVDGKNISLSVEPDIQIQTIKEMLVQKVAASSAAASSSTTPSSSISKDSNKNTLAALVCFWFAAAFYYNRLNANDLFLICNGKPLDEDCCVRDYCNNTTIKNGSTVHVSVRRNGGCFMISASVLAMICTAIVGSTCTCGLSLLAVPFLLPLLFVLPLFCL